MNGIWRRNSENKSVIITNSFRVNSFIKTIPGGGSLLHGYELGK
jgi:hypothetical protein